MLNAVLSKLLPLIPRPIVWRVAQQYIAGETLDDALRVIRHLNAHNIKATVDVLGEFVHSRQQATAARDMYLTVLDALEAQQLKSGISVKLTSLGMDIDEDFCYDNLKAVVAKARQRHRFVRIDMENSPYTTRTLQMYKRLRADGYDNVGVVIQAYLKRSPQDIEDLAQYRASVRLCKGIYNEPPEIAYQDREEIRAQFKKLLLMLFDYQMFAAIATHDEQLIRFAIAEIHKRQLTFRSYEFQMLLGVRERRRNQLVRQGYPLRVYVPFGKDWYGYSIRRLKENPYMLWSIIKNTFRSPQKLLKTKSDKG